jgi:hypothetical protein
VLPHNVVLIDDEELTLVVPATCPGRAEVELVDIDNLNKPRVNGGFLYTSFGVIPNDGNDVLNSGLFLVAEGSPAWAPGLPPYNGGQYVAGPASCGVTMTASPSSGKFGQNDMGKWSVSISEVYRDAGQTIYSVSVHLDASDVRIPSNYSGSFNFTLRSSAGGPELPITLRYMIVNTI